MVRIDMSKLRGFETIEEILFSISEGNPGALHVCVQLLVNGARIDPQAVHGGLDKLFDLDIFDIRGPDVWILYKDCCREDVALMCAAFRYVQLGGTENKEYLKEHIKKALPVSKKKIERFLRRRLTDFRYEEIK
jgi:hypothetical protein